MRLINTPITKTGQVKYFELFKIFVLVMGLVMSFSFISNQIEVHNDIIVSASLSIVSTLILMLFLAQFVLETVNLYYIVTSIILPFISVGYTVKITLVELFETVKRFFKNSKPRSDFSRLCVMRC